MSTSHLLENMKVGGEGPAPMDTIVNVIRNVPLTGGAATITSQEWNKTGVPSSYLICKEATWTYGANGGTLAVSTAAIGATDTVTVVLFTKASEKR